MAELHIDVNKLEKSAGQISDLAESLQDEQAAIAQIRGGIEEGWRSSSSRIFMEEFEEVQQCVTKMICDMEQLSREILSIAQKARNVEEQNAADFQENI